jgi:hypothetical protein
MSPPNSSSRFTAQGLIHARQAMTFNAVLVLQQGREVAGAEQPERTLEHRTDLVARLQDIDRALLHQFFETFGERRFAAADGAEQIEYLPLLFQTLSRMLEIADNALDRVFHTVEAVERPVAFDCPVEENPPEPGVLGRIDELLLADGRDHPLRWRSVEHLVVARGQQPIAQTHGFQLLSRVVAVEQIEDVQVTHAFPLLSGRVTSSSVDKLSNKWRIARHCPIRQCQFGRFCMNACLTKNLRRFFTP